MKYPDKAARQRFAKAEAAKLAKRRNTTQKKPAVQAKNNGQRGVQLEMLIPATISGKDGNSSFTIFFSIGLVNEKASEIARHLMSDLGVSAIQDKAPNESTAFWECSLKKDFRLDTKKVAAALWHKGCQVEQK